MIGFWTFALLVTSIVIAITARSLSDREDHEELEELVYFLMVIAIAVLVATCILAFFAFGYFAIGLNILCILAFIYFCYTVPKKPSALYWYFAIVAVAFLIAALGEAIFGVPSVPSPSIETNEYAIISTKEYGIDEDPSTTEYMIVKDPLTPDATYIVYCKSKDGGISMLTLDAQNSELFYFVENDTPRVEETITTTYTSDNETKEIIKTYKIFIPERTLIVSK